MAPTLFRDEEYFLPREFLSDQFEFITVSVGVSEAVGKFGGRALVDIDLQQLNPRDFDLFALCGGAGIKEFWDHEGLKTKAREFLDAEKNLAAICSAPVVLARGGLLRGKTCVCFEADRDHLLAEGAVLSFEKTAVDGAIVTGNGPGASLEFAQEIAKIIGS